MKFAISSCWNSHRHDDGYAMLRELADLGFGYVELSHGTRISLLPGILKALEDGVVRISSLHNFCPLPVGVMGAAPNLYEPSAPGYRERSLWFSNTRRTIDFANRIGCDRVVLHSGHIRFLFGNPQLALENALKTDSSPDKFHVAKAREKGLKRLRKARHPYMKRLRESFLQLGSHGREAGVVFGIENREGFAELPLDEDMEDLLTALEEAEVFGYWHDCGHAQLKERMGLLNHADFLTGLRPRLVGFHLHDVNENDRDHRIPGTGVVDWSMMAGHLREDDVVVMELSPRLLAEEIEQGRAFLMQNIPMLGAG